MIIVYHDNCHDGVTAACIALRKYPEAELYPGKHGELPAIERFVGQDVLIVDFSWKRPAMLLIEDVAKSLRVFDHHASAERELDGLAGCVFDMQRSGAGITWDELFPREPRTPLVDYVEDRDLWRFSLPRSREVHAYCDSWPLDINVRHRLLNESEVEGLEHFADQGEAILRYHEKLVAQALEERPREVIASYNVPCVALPVISMRSDVAGRLSEGEPFAATYTTRTDGSREFSLRSREGGIDVSKIAEQFGGGGHPRAAGFRVGRTVDE